MNYEHISALTCNSKNAVSVKNSMSPEKHFFGSAQLLFCETGNIFTAPSRKKFDRRKA
jgi:hypothetical protein